MFDYIIVGAGPAGLCSAKTILQCEPHASLVILDANSELGGVWAENKLYPGLKTNNLHGGIDYTDFPMHDGFGVTMDQHVTGPAMNNYIHAYAQHHDLTKHIRQGVKVNEASKVEPGGTWKLLVTTTETETETLETIKLIVATGVTNEPHRPVLIGAQDFDAPLFHTAEMGICHTKVTEDSNANTIAVLGGGKSAYDAVYMAATHGKQIEWIIRKSGKGPAWVFPPHTYLGPVKARREKLTLTRIISFLSPCFLSDGFSWLRHFFHHNPVGTLITKGFWAKIGAATLEDCGYANDDKTKVLVPTTNPFFYGTASGTLSYENDFFQYIKNGQVRIHREDITHLSAKQIHLANDTTLSVDALITATGYTAKPTIRFTPSLTHSDLGIATTSLTKSQQAFWSDLNVKANIQLGAEFPRLVAAPFEGPYSTTKLTYNPGVDPDMRYTPWRLYRGIAPPGPTTRGTHDLVFIGMFSNIANTLRLELQCLWAYAYLNNTLSIDRGGVWDDTALLARWAECRSPFGHGRYFPDIVFDQLPYFDTLLRDLGLRYWRKSNIFKEIFQPYGQSDYAGVVGEWLGTQKEGFGVSHRAMER